MWVRKKIEITPGELIRGLVYCAVPGNRSLLTEQIAQMWDQDSTFVCLSVRSGFDILLNSLDWLPDSEVIMSGLTIPDMPRIVRENGMTPVGVDIDLNSIGPNIEAIRRAITPRTRAIVVAHLLGGLVDLSPIYELAQQHDLLLIEDCAQAYSSRNYRGDPRADVSMFSFGPIKTNTALSGGVLQVRRPKLLQAMQDKQSGMPIQSRFSFAKRIAKYAVVKTLSTRIICGAIYRLMKMRGSSHDSMASTMARGFAGPGFFSKIRKQPSTPLLGLLRYKLEKYQAIETEVRREHGQFLLNSLGKEFRVLGAEMNRQTWWVFPILVDHPEVVVRKLWDAGFDATNHCSLHAIFDSDDSIARTVLKHIVFLPLHCDMPKRELTRLARIVRESGVVSPAFSELAESAADDEFRPTATRKPEKIRAPQLSA